MSARYRILLFLLATIPLLAVAGCTASKPPRPYGNLGDSVNSRFDEFAPTLRPGRGGLYFTSNRVASEDIWRSGVSDPADPSATFASAVIDASDITRLSRPSTNDGSTVFITANEGFFASGHAPDTLFARDERTYGGIVGGTDLFEFQFTASGLQAWNLGPAINSPFWDSHPAAAIRGDSLLLIFSSDRPSNGAGYSSPYSGAVAIGNAGDSLHGNADLYYVFRVGGKWSQVRNFALSGGSHDVNSRGNEYSPFLYCIDEHPRLLFSTDRESSFDIWEAELSVDFAHQQIAVTSLDALPRGTDSINTSWNEIFPVMTAPAPGRPQYLYVASDRDSAGRMVGGKEVKSVGGYDLYRFPFSRECSPPRARYEVTLIDAENPSRPVPLPIARLHRTNAPIADGAEPGAPPEQELHENPALFTVDFDSDYGAFGGSEYNEVHCDDRDRAIESYGFMRIRSLEPEIRRRVTSVMRDSLIGAHMEKFTDSTFELDTIPISSAGSIASTATSIIQRVDSRGDRLIVTRVNLEEHERPVDGHWEKRKVQLVEYDTLARLDTMMVPSTQALAPSERVKRMGSIVLGSPRNDIVIRDTVYLLPHYYQPPPCEWVYTRGVLDEYRKNVPYFQTAFWEVNTTENLKRDLKRFSTGELADAGFIELHPGNLTFGTGSAKRQDRINEYTDFAKAVDKNLAAMASDLAEQIIPNFMAYDAKTPASNNRLVIQVAAYSDFRQIQRGYYAGKEEVNYVAGIFDSARGVLNLRDVSIPPGASLVSENNDTLSKLRVYFGYRELLTRLEAFPLFKRLVDDGTILLPTSVRDADEFRSRMTRAKIIVVMEGMNTDRSIRPSVPGYTGHGNDFYSLDDIRRMDLQVNRLEYINGRLVKSPCCSDAPGIPTKE